jgi:surface carbohydrate biosynthesis protein
MEKTVVILVDDKKRDLPGCALIAHHLEQKFSIRCALQPLESWRSCLAAFQPHYILFNHLTASHLAHFSKRLHDMGVLVGVLPNEGIIYNQEVLEFNAGRYHDYAHIDQFFCWNEIHKNALAKIINLNEKNIYVVGVPRFDFYFSPWIDTIDIPNFNYLNRPRILVCTNFAYAQYLELPKIYAERLFSPWKDRIPSYNNYWEIIKINAECRTRFFDYLNSLIEQTEYVIDLKPHPGEDYEPYKKWFKYLPEKYKKKVTLRLTGTIYEVLPTCDLEISCERCTTALESWILGKPTIELVFQKHPIFFNEETASCNRLCESPEQLPELVEFTLKNPEQEDLRPLRRQHLQQWCASPSGNSSLQVAELIATAVAQQDLPQWRLTFQDRRRGTKLKIKDFCGLAYGSTPWKVLWNMLPNVKPYFLESKYITPAEVRNWREKLRRLATGRN